MDFATRYDFLKTAVGRYDNYYNLAAVKASLLLTSNAIFLAPALGSHQPWLQIAGVTTPVKVLNMLAALLALASIIYAAWAIASHLDRKGRQGYRSLMFTESVAAQTPEDYANGLAGMDEADILADLGHLAHLLALGVTRTFRHINRSLVTLVLAVLCAFVALALQHPAG